MILAGILLAAATETPEILALRCERIKGGSAIKILATSSVGQVTSEHIGDAVVFLIPATVRDGDLAMPALVPPVQALAFESLSPVARLRVTTAPSTRVESRADGSLLTFSFHSAGAAEEPSAPGDVEQLYPLLFPQAAELASPLPAASTSDRDEPTRGLSLGSISARPALAIRYVNAESTFLESPKPVHVSYLEVQPQLQLTSPAFGGTLRLSYELRLRRGEDAIPVLKQPSHFLSADFTRPIGSSSTLTLSDQYGRGAIETQVLDPGREYFYDIRQFKRNQAGFSLTTKTGGPVGLSLSGSIAKESLTPGAAYFDNERQAVGGGLNCELTPELKLSLGYQFERVPPPPERPLAEMRAHDVSLGLQGNITSTLRAGVSAGYRQQRSPRAPQGGDRYDGPVWAGNLRREFLNGAGLTLSGSRSPQLSAFENNAFYIADTVQIQLIWPLPSAFQVTGGITYQWNDYRLPALGLDEPRSDRLLGWSAGLGRVLTRWASLRADYSADRRRSNVPGLSTRTHSLVVQLTLGANGGR